jgi:hypothetical protein
LQTLAVPPPETIDRFESGWTEAQHAVQRIDQQIGQWTGQRETHDRELEQLRLEHDVPSEDDLVRARQRRDQAWQWIRQTLRDGQPSDQRPRSIHRRNDGRRRSGRSIPGQHGSGRRAWPTGCAAKPARSRERPC